MDIKDFDIASNAKMIEIVKSELLDSCSDVFKSLLYSGGKDDLTHSLSNIVLLAYILGRRCGIPFKEIDSGILDKAKIGIIDEHKLETMFKDLSKIKKHIGERID